MWPSWVFELVTPGYPVERATNCAMEPGYDHK